MKLSPKEKSVIGINLVSEVRDSIAQYSPETYMVYLLTRIKDVCNLQIDANYTKCYLKDLNTAYLLLRKTPVVDDLIEMGARQNGMYFNKALVDQGNSRTYADLHNRVSSLIWALEDLFRGD